jgi:hypothetical protein
MTASRPSPNFGDGTRSFQGRFGATPNFRFRARDANHLIRRFLGATFAAIILAGLGDGLNLRAADESLASAITSPVDGSIRVPTETTIRWSTVSRAKSYYLYVGMLPGTKDVVDTGEIQATTFLARHLPAGRLLFATIHTRVGETWHHSALAFTTMPQVATITYPVNGAANVPSNCDAQWSKAPEAEAYQLYFGTTPGMNDVLDSKRFAQGQYSLSVSGLPAGKTLYGTIWTRLHGVWYSSGIAFSTQ